MACVHCGGAVDAATQLWNVGSLCTAELNKLKSEYVHPSADLVLDLVKIHTLLWYNEPFCLTAMTRLETELAGARGLAIANDPRFAKGGLDYVKLSRALEYYEAMCWFPPNRMLLLGILSNKDFFKSQKLGFAKDTGAQGLHGEQSHRVQWHAIMHHVTAGFQMPIARLHGWRYSPLELYYEVTQGDARTSIGRDAWGYLMDSRNNDGWANPDNVVRTALKQGDLPLFQKAFERRVAKIGGPKHLSPTSVQQKSETKDGALQTAIENACFAIPIVYRPNYATLVLAWRKGEPIPKRPTAAEADALTVYNYLLTSHGTRVSPYDKNVGTNMVASPATKLKTIDSSLVKKSRDRFNPGYSYSMTTGAQPINPLML